jgi:hypothetical protein
VGQCACGGAVCLRWGGLPAVGRSACGGAVCLRWGGLPVVGRSACEPGSVIGPELAADLGLRVAARVALQAAQGRGEDAMPGRRRGLMLTSGRQATIELAGTAPCSEIVA